mgnify:CR=1 FL=1
MPLDFWLRETAAAAAYGASAVALAHPLDTLKTRQQTHVAYAHAGGPLAALRLSLAHDGVGGLLRGLAPALASSMLFRALPFAAYGWTTEWLRGAAPDFASAQPLLVAALAGASGGLLRACAEVPLEALKVQAQVGRGGSGGRGGRGGIAALYAGLPITALRNATVVALFWTFYVGSADTRHLLCGGIPALASFVGGAGCSTAAWLVVFPLDVVKSRVQGDGAHLERAQRGGHRNLAALAAARDVYAASGVGGFYRGLRAGLARSVVANGGAMVAYDAVRTWLGPD